MFTLWLTRIFSLICSSVIEYFKWFCQKSYLHIAWEWEENPAPIFCSFNRYLSLSPRSPLYILFSGGARGVMDIVVGNGHGDTSSNPGRD